MSEHSIPFLERSDRRAWYFFGAWFTLATLGLALHKPWAVTLSFAGIWLIVIYTAIRLAILAYQFRHWGQKAFFRRTCLLLFILFGAVAVQLLIRR